jgi:L-galactose dehydrogenase
MEYRTLGRTNLKISSLGFGCSPLGGVFGDIDEKEAIDTVHNAIERGINYFDTSPYYGLTKSETVLGKALKGIPREKYILSTKVGRYGPKEFDFSAERVTKSLHESLGRLGVEYVDIVVCHDIEFVSLDKVINEAIPALKKLRDQGKLKYIGISGLPLYIYKYVLDHTNDIDVVLSYCHSTLLDDSLLAMIPYFKSKNVGVINASPLSMGLLTHQGPPEWHPAQSDIKEVSKKVAEYCEKNSINVSQLALNYSAHKSADVHTTLVGIQNNDILNSNIEALTLKFDQKVLEDLAEIVKPVHNKTWSSGLPENNADVDQ